MLTGNVPDLIPESGLYTMDNLPQTRMCSWELFASSIIPRCRELLSMCHLLGNTEATSEASAQLPGVNWPYTNAQIPMPAEWIILTFQLYDLIFLLFVNEKELSFLI